MQAISVSVEFLGNFQPRMFAYMSQKDADVLDLHAWKNHLLWMAADCPVFAHKNLECSRSKWRSVVVEHARKNGDASEHRRLVVPAFAHSKHLCCTKRCGASNWWRTLHWIAKTPHQTSTSIVDISPYGLKILFVPIFSKQIESCPLRVDPWRTTQLSKTAQLWRHEKMQNEDRQLDLGNCARKVRNSKGFAGYLLLLHFVQWERYRPTAEDKTPAFGFIRLFTIDKYKTDVRNQ